MPCGVATRHSCSCEGEEKNRSREDDSEESSDEEATCDLVYESMILYIVIYSPFILQCLSNLVRPTLQERVWRTNVLSR